MNTLEKNVQNSLFELQDIKYKEFHAKLIPNIAPDRIIGIRTPVLRKFAKEFSKTDEAKEFIKILPHRYYEENNLHAFIIEGMKDFSETMAEIEKFLPYVDNWATCDSMSPKSFKKNLPQLYKKILEWINSEHTYTVRFAVGMLMRFYLDEGFKPEMLDIVVGVNLDEYYVKMMVAWYMATALAKQYAFVLPYIENKKLEPWTHNKAIQKAIESYRITPEQKSYLRTLKI